MAKVESAPAVEPVDTRQGAADEAFISQLLRARNVGVPLVVVRTADQSETALAVQRAAKGQPVVRWDASQGLAAYDDAGKDVLKKLKISLDDTVNFDAAMRAVADITTRTLVLVFNAHRQLFSTEPGATAASVQAVSNLRDKLKQNFRMLILMGPYGFTMPMELEPDVVVLEHELPDDATLGTIITEVYDSAKLAKPDDALIGKGIEAVTGLTQFGAEQVVAMGLDENGLDLKRAWERKRVSIEQTRGLSVYRGPERFSDIVGMDSVKARLRQKMKSRRGIGCVLLLDEIDKVLANVEQDTTGARMDQLRTLLTVMEDAEWQGLLLTGLPGGGKTLIAKAFGNEAGVPTIIMDLGAMEDKYVGESEANMRAAMAKIKAIGRGRAYVVATSNNATVMRPELQRRFTGGFFFVDMLGDEERKAAWDFYEKKYGLPKQERPLDDGWTGAEIRNCARDAYDSDIPLIESAKFVLPVAQARADEFMAMRAYAGGRYLDAHRPGPYSHKLKEEVGKRLLRAIELPTDKSKLN